MRLEIKQSQHSAVDINTQEPQRAVKNSALATEFEVLCSACAGASTRRCPCGDFQVQRRSTMCTYSAIAAESEGLSAGACQWQEHMCSDIAQPLPPAQRRIPHADAANRAGEVIQARRRKLEPQPGQHSWHQRCILSRCQRRAAPCRRPELEVQRRKQVTVTRETGAGALAEDERGQGGAGMAECRVRRRLAERARPPSPRSQRAQLRVAPAWRVYSEGRAGRARVMMVDSAAVVAKAGPSDHERAPSGSGPPVYAPSA